MILFIQLTPALDCFSHLCCPEAGTDFVLCARPNSLAKDVCFRTQGAQHCLEPRTTEIGWALHTPQGQEWGFKSNRVPVVKSYQSTAPFSAAVVFCLLLIKGLCEKPQMDTQFHHTLQHKQELRGVLFSAASVLHLYKVRFRGIPYGLIY